MNPKNKERLAKRIEQLRKEAGMSQRQFAKKIKMNPQRYSRIARRVSVMRADDLAIFMKAGYNVEWILEAIK